MKWYEYTFKLIWGNKFILYKNHVIMFSIACADEQTAREKAFEKAMTIHKNMCMKYEDFSNEWYYSGIELVRVVPYYRYQ